MNSQTLANLSAAGNLTELKKVGFCDAGQNGKLPIWKIRSPAYDLFLVLIARDNVVVEICLRGDDADDLKKYLDGLKELARSIRIVEPGAAIGVRSKR